ncbi:3',5'-cyclic AMP phosphodiesterase CpdA [Anoxybacillus vitaminiphilus]|uniref:3',5'-cyclic AMP phosphodiesterase CpdA n=1 Tax=Paranoxybacillus vitaminiphilus TaxID=581036 RepID=A0A327YBI7_9BACL|nr:metallophosphoesterase [Anoxybacillus vitaminiphilus]RAK18194.1 3',5'-cyclic AMP phosphodiesterase CpdA [Anoxybacillus vitaminiphilus]
MGRRLLEKLKRFWLALIVIRFVAGDLSWNVQAEEKNSKSGQEREPELVFPVISDVHIKKSGTIDMQKFQVALEQLNEQAPKQDAVVVVGDLTDNGLQEEYDRFFSLYNVKKHPKAVSLITIGNHDYRNGLSEAGAQKRFLTETGMESIYNHKVIKGYHFIILGTESRLTEGYYSKEQIQWLGKQLEQAEKDDPKKPIFVFQHHPIKHTVFGSEWSTEMNRELLYNTLKEYPQVIHFSGHTHYPLDDPRTIHQKDFTSVGTSSVSYIWTGAGYLQGELPPGHQNISQGLIVEVYKNKVVIKRRDFHKNDWTGEPWEIQLPVKVNQFDYTETRDPIKPSFPKDASISAAEEKITASSLEITFTQAVDNLLLHSYKVNAKEKETGETAKEYKAFSEFYHDPVPNLLTLPVQGLKPRTTYVIEVTALDAFGNESENSLIMEAKTKAE